MFVRTIPHLTLTPSSELNMIPAKIRCSFIPEEICRNFSLHSHLRINFPNLPLIFNFGIFSCPCDDFLQIFTCQQSIRHFPTNLPRSVLGINGFIPGPSRTNCFRQSYHKPTMVWRNLTPYNPFYWLLSLCHALFCTFWSNKSRQSTKRGGAGASCVRPWLTCDIV